MSQTFFKDPLGRGRYLWPRRISSRTITITFLSTLGIAGLGWFVFGFEPVASRLEPLTSKVRKLMKGTRVPTVPTENDEGMQVEGPVEQSAPKSTPLSTTGVSGGQAEGRNIQGVER